MPQSRSISILSCLLILVASTMANSQLVLSDEAEITGSISGVPMDLPRVLPNLPSRLLFDNGPLITSTGTGAGGADESILQLSSLGMTTIGTSNGAPIFRIADDIRLTSTSLIESITLYGYQVGSGTTSTLTNVSLRIWDGVPGEEGSNVVFGDTDTNQMVSSEFTNIYRVTDISLGDDLRPIMSVTIEPDIVLGFGVYWLDWQMTGSEDNGPFTPHVTIVGQTETGDALLSFDNGETWIPLLDNSVELGQAVPIQVTGRQILTIPVNHGTGLFILICLITLFAWYIHFHPRRMVRSSTHQGTDDRHR